MTTTPVRTEQREDGEDALDLLAAGFELVTASAVDMLQVAASLESIGVTDDLARTRYGQHDVFALARELRARAAAGGAPPGDGGDVAPPESPDPHGRTTILNGFLYLIPAIALPAVLAMLSARETVVALLTGGGLGWMWTSASSWLEYRLAGSGRAGRAAELVQRATAGGLVLALLAGAGVVLATGGSLLAGALTVAVMAYQLGTMALFFLRQRAWILWAMWPAAMAGTAYLVTGEPAQGRRLVAVVAALGVASVLVLAWLCAARSRRASPATSGGGPSLRGLAPGIPAVLGCAALSAAYLLTAQGAFLFASFDVAVGLVGLIVAMGFVEWRAGVLPARVRALLRQVSYPAELHAAVPRLLGRELWLCALVSAVTSAGVCAGLLATRGLTLQGVLVALAAPPLSGAYLLTFAHANMGRYGWTASSFAIALLLQAGAGLTPQVTWPEAFLLSAVVLLALLRAGFTRRPSSATSYQ